MGVIYDWVPIVHCPSVPSYNGEMPTKKSSDTSNDILIAEYEYIANSASQANEDRARVASFYLVAVGSLVAAMFSTQIFDTTSNFATLSFLFSGLFFVLTLLGTLTVIQLARLRSGLVRIDDRPKSDQGIRDQQRQRPSGAFRWRAKTMPPLYKTNSISYQQTIEVAVLSGLMLGAAIYFLLVGIGDKYISFHWAFAIGSTVIGFAAQLYVYKMFLLHNHKEN